MIPYASPSKIFDCSYTSPNIICESIYLTKNDLWFHTPHQKALHLSNILHQTNLWFHLPHQKQFVLPFVSPKNFEIVLLIHLTKSMYLPENNLRFHSPHQHILYLFCLTIVIGKSREQRTPIKARWLVKYLQPEITLWYCIENKKDPIQPLSEAFKKCHWVKW